MTIIITLFRLVDLPAYSYSNYSEDPLIPEGWPEFESCIQLEDAAFALGIRFISRGQAQAHDETHQLFVRPRDFEQARDWVLDTHSIKKNNKPELLDMLNALEEDRNLYMHFSW